MNYDFLKRLFTSCSDEADERYMDGMNLCELYERVGEVATAEQDWGETRGKAALSVKVADDIETAAYRLANAYELQGFINGFRLCAQMLRELHGIELMAEQRTVEGIVNHESCSA